MDDQGRKRWQITTRLGRGFVAWRPGYGLPRRWTSRLDGDHLPYVVELDFVADDERGPDCRSVRFLVREGGEPIAGRAIREVPITECLNVAIGAAAAREEQRPGEVVYRIGGGDPDVTEQHQLAARAPRTSDEHLREVADVYSRTPEKPTQAVQHHFAPTSYSTAARWVMQARRRGFLPPAQRGPKREEQ